MREIALAQHGTKPSDPLCCLLDRMPCCAVSARHRQRGPLIHKLFFVVQYRREAGLTGIFA